VDYGSPAPRGMSFRLIRLPSGDAEQRMRFVLFATALLTWSYDLFTVAAQLS
jgi:hypothetical protein